MIVIYLNEYFNLVEIFTEIEKLKNPWLLESDINASIFASNNLIKGFFN